MSLILKEVLIVKMTLVMECPRCSEAYDEGEMVYINKRGEPCCWDCYYTDDILVPLRMCSEMDAEKLSKFSDRQIVAEVMDILDTNQLKDLANRLEKHSV